MRVKEDLQCFFILVFTAWVQWFHGWIRRSRSIYSVDFLFNSHCLPSCDMEMWCHRWVLVWSLQHGPLKKLEWGNDKLLTVPHDEHRNSLRLIWFYWSSLQNSKFPVWDQLRLWSKTHFFKPGISTCSCINILGKTQTFENRNRPLPTPQPVK